MAHHFILLRFNLYSLRVNGEGWWFEPSVSWLRVCLSAVAAVIISWLRLSPLREWGSWPWHLLVNMYIYGSLFHLATAQSLWPLGWWGGMLVWVLCVIAGCRFACQQRVLKTFPGHGYLRFEDEVVWLWHLLVNLYIYGSPFHLATAQSLWP